MPRFYGQARALVESDDDRKNPYIAVEIVGPDAMLMKHSNEAYAALSVEDAAKLAEELDAAIDLYARTDRARAEAKAARIAALKATLAELEA